MTCAKGIRLRDVSAVAILIWGVMLFMGCASTETTAQLVPVIQYQYTGGPTSTVRTEFLLSIYEDGAVVFDGKNRTRVSGEARIQVTKQKAQEWQKALVDAGAMTKRERPDFHPIPDRDWWRMTVRRDGVTNSYRYLRHPIAQVEDKIIQELDVFNRWVR